MIFTNNGCNFVSTNNLLRLVSNLISGKFDICKIILKYNPPSSPRWRGWWERLVGMLKEFTTKKFRFIIFELWRALSYDFTIWLCVCCQFETTNLSLRWYWHSTSMIVQPIVKSHVCDLDKIYSLCLNKRIRYVQRFKKS